MDLKNITYSDGERPETKQNPMYNDLIFVAKYSLHYETRPTTFMMIDRQAYSNLQRERKEGKTSTDYYYRRLSYTRFKDEQYIENRAEIKRQYSEAIQKKYKVGKNWESNRYFVEQVRPTI